MADGKPVLSLIGPAPSASSVGLVPSLIGAPLGPVPSLIGAPLGPVPSLIGQPIGATPSPISQPPAAAAPASGPTEPPKQHFPLPSDVPTQIGPAGLRYDFNFGCRVGLPDSGGPWKVRLSDIETGNLLYETEMKSGMVATAKRYFVRVRVEVSTGGEIVLTHDYDARDRDVMVQFPVGTLGDIMGWFPYAVKFQRDHGCRLSVAMADWIIPLFRDSHPHIEFLTHEQVKADRYYATYNIGLFFDDDANIQQPCDFRLVGLHRTSGYILGVDPSDEPPAIAVAEGGRPMEEPYVCIATQSTTQCKYWNNPHGWRDVIQYLKAAGYRVVCIDRNAVNGGGLVWNHMPHGVEDETGDRPLQERARWLKHAEFFVGLSSGLSWVAWAVGTPVVMISGFTHPSNEFTTPYRVINYHTCNSCWNDVRLRFDHHDFLWCPRHKDTPRQFECSRLITAEQVKATIRRVPGFLEMQQGHVASEQAPERATA